MYFGDGTYSLISLIFFYIKKNIDNYTLSLNKSYYGFY